jgi:hypothetical protein
MIRIENAQNVISKIHTKYDEVSVHTNNALVCSDIIQPIIFSP